MKSQPFFTILTALTIMGSLSAQENNTQTEQINPQVAAHFERIEGQLNQILQQLNLMQEELHNVKKINSWFVQPTAPTSPDSSSS